MTIENEETTQAETETAAPQEVQPPPETEAPEQPGAEADDDAVEDEVIVSIGEPPPQAQASEEERDPKLVNKLRRLLREQERKTREYEAKLREYAAPVENKPPTLGPKPTLEAHDYDAEKYEEALASWFDRKRVADEHAAKQKRENEEREAAWKAQLDGYQKAKATLRVRDYEEAEANVVQTLDVTQQGIIVSAAQNPALVTYALGKDPAKLKELAGIRDYVKFAAAIGRLEPQLKTTPRKPPAPEQPIKGAAPGGDHTSRTLEQLREGVANGSVPMSKLLEFKKTHNIRV